MSEISLSKLCACLGPYGTDPHCPCHMQTLRLDGAYNCYGDKDAQERRRKADEERLAVAMRKFGEKMDRRAGDDDGKGN